MSLRGIRLPEPLTGKRRLHFADRETEGGE